MFNFNSLLNAHYLHEIYGDDLTIVQIMFKSFLDDNIPIWQRISDEFSNKNYERVGAMAHQIKASFPLVGLTALYPKMQDFEFLAKENNDEIELLAKYNNLTIEINQAKMIINDELNRLNQHS